MAMERGSLGLGQRVLLLAAWLVSCGFVYVLGFYVGKGMHGAPQITPRVSLPVEAAVPPLDDSAIQQALSSHPLPSWSDAKGPPTQRPESLPVTSPSPIPDVSPELSGTLTRIDGPSAGDEEAERVSFGDHAHHAAAIGHDGQVAHIAKGEQGQRRGEGRRLCHPEGLGGHDVSHVHGLSSMMGKRLWVLRCDAGLQWVLRLQARRAKSAERNISGAVGNPASLLKRGQP